MATLPPGGNELGFATLGHLRDAASATQHTVQVDSSPVLVLAANPKRNGFLLSNNGLVAVWWGFVGNLSDGSVAGAGGGFFLPGFPSAVSMGPSDGYTGPVYAMSTGGSAILSIGEW